MLTLYLACLIFGGVFIIVSLFFGSDADADVDTGGDLHFDSGGDAHFDAGGGGHDVHIDSSAGADVHHGEGLAETIKFLSLRNIVFFIAFFGLTGTVLTWLGAWPIFSFPVAVGMGFFSAALMHKALRYLVKTEVSGGVNLEDLSGLSAKVLIDLSKNQRGKISLKTGGQFMQLLALVADVSGRQAFKAGEEVIILEVKNGLAYVVEKEFIFQREGGGNA